MKYGCIGERLKHSFSKEIHNLLSDYEYELKEIPQKEFDHFMKNRDFLGINVTIPYKERVIPYLDFIDENAKNIGAVNTILNKDGLLYGYNTDFFGMQALLDHAKIDLKGKKVAILGTGGTSKTANEVAKKLSAQKVITVSRKSGNGFVDYEDFYREHKDTDVIINTTPLGMYPDIFSKAVDLKKFPNLKGVVDAVYNPLRSLLVAQGKKLGIPAEGGLFMLVSQAVRASELFVGKNYQKAKLNFVYEKIKKEKDNIVLIGMGACGKSTVGKLVAKSLGRTFLDTDNLIEEKIGLKIPEIFSKMGEQKFREIEEEVVKEVSKNTCLVIATGGGVPLKKENIDALSMNGKIYFIDRPLENLLPTEDRPLANTREEIAKRYNERYEIYTLSADVKIEANFDAKKVAEAIMGDFML